MQVSLLIRKELVERARDFNIILDDVSLTELSFGKEYTAAIEAKQVAQQEAQRAVFFVERAKQEKQQKIVQAEGEAEAAKMISFLQNTIPQLIPNLSLLICRNIVKVDLGISWNWFLLSKPLYNVTIYCFTDLYIAIALWFAP